MSHEQLNPTPQKAPSVGRRSFLRYFGIGAIAAGATLAGCAPGEQIQNPENPNGQQPLDGNNPNVSESIDNNAGQQAAPALPEIRPTPTFETTPTPVIVENGHTGGPLSPEDRNTPAFLTAEQQSADLFMFMFGGPQSREVLNQDANGSWVDQEGRMVQTGIFMDPDKQQGLGYIIKTAPNTSEVEEIWIATEAQLGPDGHWVFDYAKLLQLSPTEGNQLVLQWGNSPDGYRPALWPQDGSTGYGLEILDLGPTGQFIVGPDGNWMEYAVAPAIPEGALLPDNPRVADIEIILNGPMGDRFGRFGFGSLTGPVKDLIRSMTNQNDEEIRHDFMFYSGFYDGLQQGPRGALVNPILIPNLDRNQTDLANADRFWQEVLTVTLPGYASEEDFVVLQTVDINGTPIGQHQIVKPSELHNAINAVNPDSNQPDLVIVGTWFVGTPNMVGMSTEGMIAQAYQGDRSRPLCRDLNDDEFPQSGSCLAQQPAFVIVVRR